MKWFKKQGEIVKNDNQIQSKVEEDKTMQLLHEINHYIDKGYESNKYKDSYEYNVVKKTLNKINSYKEKLLPQNIITDSIDGLKNNDYTTEGLFDCAYILEYTALPPSILRVMAQDPLVALAIETLSNQASRDLPKISIYSLNDYNPDQKDYTYLNEYVYNKLVENRISNLLRESVSQSKTYGVVNILKMPTIQKDNSYWEAPFNLESIGIDSNINFEIIIPDKITPYYDLGLDNYNIYEQPTYWKILYKGEYLIVHNTHLIRVIESPQYGEELIRYNYRGRSLVEAIYPVAKTIRNLEKKRSHLLQIKGVVTVNIPASLVSSYSKGICTEAESGNINFFARFVSKLGEMMNTTVARSNLIALPEGAELKNVDVSLSDVNDNIDSYYRRLSALSSLPLSTLGLTPPRGINDSGAVEADGSRRAIETNQNIILRPILLDIIKIYTKKGMQITPEINYNINDLGFDIEFQTNDAPTAIEEAEVASKWVELVGALVDRHIITKQSALDILTTQITVSFDNAVGLPEYEEDYDKESAMDIFKQMELEASKLDRDEDG